MKLDGGGMPKRQQRCERWAFAILLLLVSVQGLQPPAKPRISRGSFLVGAASVFVGAVLPSWADEIGMENDAPTLITGETVEVGPADVLGGLGGSLLADEQRCFHHIVSHWGLFLIPRFFSRFVRNVVLWGPAYKRNCAASGTTMMPRNDILKRRLRIRVNQPVYPYLTMIAMH